MSTTIHQKRIRQGDTISPELENVLKTLDWVRKGTKIDNLYINRPRFADDFMLVNKNLKERS